jgi:hypothetical protein
VQVDCNNVLTCKDNLYQEKSEPIITSTSGLTKTLF